MAGENVADPAVALQGGVERVDRGSGHAEADRDPFLFENVNGGFDRCHLGHWFLPSLGSVFVSCMPAPKHRSGGASTALDSFFTMRNFAAAR
jgi:hypothetical protein